MRRLSGAGLLSLALFLVPVATPAQAKVTASSITSPATGSGFLNNSAAPSSTVMFTVTGTTTGSGNVDIDCFDGYSGTPSRFTLVADQPAPGNRFSVPVTQKEIDSSGVGTQAWGNDTCVLRAVDAGDSSDYRPDAKSAFSGPTISISLEDLISSGKYTADFGYSFSGHGGALGLASAGSDGLQAGFLYSPGSLTWSKDSFGGMGGLYGPDANENSSFPNGEIKVDGAYVNDSASGDPSLTGYEGLTQSGSLDTTTDTLVIHDDEPLLDCVPSLSDCERYRASGVELYRTWRLGTAGEIATQTDVFRSVDGKAHTVAVDEDDAVCDDPNCESSGSSLASFEFPGSSSFKVYTDGQTVRMPSSGPGTILFKTDSSTPAAGDGSNPQGAITYASPPTGAVLFTPHAGNSSDHQPEFVLPYTRSIPAGGSTVLRFAYVQNFALSTVEAQAQATIAGYAPQVTIATPANGATVNAATVTVTGTAGDSAGVKSLTVDGVSASVQPDGAWSATVDLRHGANTIIATATDNDGIVGRSQITVTDTANVPALSRGRASGIRSSRARLSATVDPDGLPTTYEFRYSRGTTYASHMPAGSAGSGITAVKVTVVLKRLRSHTTYHYELIATNALGTSVSTGRFKTRKRSSKGRRRRMAHGIARSLTSPHEGAPLPLSGDGGR